MPSTAHDTCVDLAFSLTGNHPLPADHGYLVYAAISRVLPTLHEPNGLAVHPIRGRLIGDRQMQLCDFSRLCIRVPSERIAELLPLAGKQLQIAGRPVLIGVPQVQGLSPAPSLRSRLVTIKVSASVSPDSSHRPAPQPPDAPTFLTAARKQLDALGITSSAELALGKRRTLRVKEKEVVGYETLVEGLTAEESLSLQTHGLGGRRHMGCGVFVPFGQRYA